MFRCLAVLFVATILTLGVSSSANAAEADAKWTKCNVGKYKAHQIDKIVVVVGYGHHPTGGFKVKFRLLPIDIDPPQYELLHQKPGGFTIQVITPFTALAHFKATRPIKSIIVHDANGKHKVVVEQAKK